MMGNRMTDQDYLKQIREGMKIRVNKRKDGDESQEWDEKSKTRHYRVQKIYPHMIFCIDRENGFKRCFGIGDLIMMGLVRQEAELEEKRR